MEQRFKYFLNEVIKLVRGNMKELHCKVTFSVAQSPKSTWDKVDFHVDSGYSHR